MTSEEVREKRRAERKQFKQDRADAIARAAAEAEAAFAEGRKIETTVVIPSGATWKPQASAANEPVPSPPGSDEEEEEELEPIPELEHLQLTFQEAFFLVWTLDCLVVHHPTTVRTWFSYCILPWSERCKRRRKSCRCNSFGPRFKMPITFLNQEICIPKCLY